MEKLNHVHDYNIARSHSWQHENVTFESFSSWEKKAYLWIYETAPEVFQEKKNLKLFLGIVKLANGRKKLRQYRVSILEDTIENAFVSQ